MGELLCRCAPETIAVQLLDQNNPNYAYLSGAKQILAAQFAHAQLAADQVMSGGVPDPTGGATHYYAITMPKAQAWAAKATQTLRLGHCLLQGCVVCRPGLDDVDSRARLRCLNQATRGGHAQSLQGTSREQLGHQVAPKECFLPLQSSLPEL